MSEMHTASEAKSAAPPVGAKVPSAIEAAQAEVERLEGEAERIETERARVTALQGELEAKRPGLAREKVRAVDAKDPKATRQAKGLLQDCDDRLDAARLDLRDLEAAAQATAAALTAARGGLDLAVRRQNDDALRTLISTLCATCGQIEGDLQRVTGRLAAAETLLKNIVLRARHGDRQYLMLQAFLERFMETVRLYLGPWSNRTLDPPRLAQMGAPIAPFADSELAILRQYLDPEIPTDDEQEDKP